MTKRQQRYALLAAMVPAAMLVVRPVWGDTYTYLGDNSSNTWSTAALWTGGSGSYPSLAGDVANVTRDFTTGQQGLVINVPITLGILNDGDTVGSPTENVTIGNTTNVLTFDNNGSAAQINQISTAGIGFIANPIVMMGDLQISNASASALNFSASVVTNPISGTGSLASGASGGTQTILFGGTGTGGGTLSAPISNGSTGGTVAVTVNGGGNWIFSSTSSTYTGATTINTGGTLLVTGSLSSTAINVNGGTFGEFSNPSTGSLSGTSSLTVGNGTANLQGSNTYSGNTTVSGGTLALTGSLSGTAITLSSGTFSESGSGGIVGISSFTISGGLAKFLGTGTQNYSGGTSLNGGTLQYNAAARLSSSNVNFNGGVLEGALNGLVFNETLGTGVGQVQWTGSGGFSAIAGTSFAIDLNGGTGTVTWGSGGFVPNGSSLLFGSSTQGATPNFQNGIDLGSAARTVFVNSSTGSGEISGVIQGSGGSLVKDGPGALFLPNVSNTYTGGTTVKAGTLQLASDSDLGPVPGSAAVNITLDGGAIQGNLTISPTRTIQLNSGGGTFNTQQIPALGSGGGTIIYAGVVQGNGGLSAIGSGTLRLNGINTYSGGTTITGLSGSLRCTVVTRATGATLGASTNALVMTNAILDTFGQPLTVGSLSGDANSIITNGNQNANNSFTVNNTDSSSFAGIIGNESFNNRPMALTKSGTGSLLLSGANNFTGAVVVSSNGGTLQIGSPTALGFGGSLNKVANGSSVQSTTVNTGGTVDLNGQTINEPIILSGGSLINSNASTAAKVDNGVAGIQWTSGGAGYSGTITVGISGTGTGAAATAAQTSGVISGIATTAAGSGYTSVPTVTITGSGGGSGATPTAILSSVTLTSATNNSIGGAGNLSIPAVISGAGTLTKIGAGTLALSGSNTYTGTTTVSNGTLLAANTAGSATGTNTVSVNGTGSLGGSGTISGAVTINSGGTIFTGASPSHTTAATLTVGPLTLGGSTLLNLTALPASTPGIGSADEIISSGLLTFGGTLTVADPNSLAYAAGDMFDLFSFGSKTGSFSAPPTLPTLGSSLSWDTTKLTTNGIISIVSAGPANLFFTGSAWNGNWDTGSTTNFTDGSTALAFHTGDNVTFDTAHNTGFFTIAVAAGGVVPAAMTVTGATPYTFSGGNIGSASSTSLTVASGASMTFDRGTGSRVTLELGSLSNSGLIDLMNNTMLLHGADSTVAATVRSELQSGYNTGGWNGVSGIISSTAQNDTLHTLGESLVGTNLTVAYTYYGDTDLSGVIDGTDYSVIDTHNGLTTGGTWQTGDFNYDGSVDGSDYSLIDNAFNMQNGGDAVTAAQVAVSTSEFAGGSAAVPEPASLGLLGIGAIGLMGRRRRKM